MGLAPYVPGGDEYEDARKAYVEWYALPDEEKTPATQGELAKRLGVHRKTLWDWSTQDWFQRAVRHVTFVRLSKHRSNVYRALVKKATGDGDWEKADVRAIKHYSELLGDHVQQIDITSNGEGIAIEDARKMSTEELAASLADGQKERLEALGVSPSDFVKLLTGTLSGTTHQDESHG